MARPHIMGVVNVTPDSFSDGGRFFDTDRAIAGASQMARAGASILDIGGESTRPNAEAVSHADEIARITPVLSGLAEQGVTLSADTRHTEVMSAGLEAGANSIKPILMPAMRLRCICRASRKPCRKTQVMALRR